MSDFKNQTGKSPITAEQLKTQLAKQGSAIAQVIAQLSEQQPELDERLEEIRGELFHRQTYLENLVDEVTRELDDLRCQFNLLNKKVAQMGQSVAALEEQPDFAANFAEHVQRHSSIPPLLSSIPPRHLSEDEARQLLGAIDQIIERRQSVLPTKLGSDS